MESLLDERDSKFTHVSKYVMQTEQSDFSDCLSEIVRSALIETIDKQLKSKHCQIDVSSATKKGDYNFSGIIYRVTFKRELECENGDSTVPSSVILKCAPQNESRRVTFSVRVAFTREIYTYDTILPAFREFELARCGAPNFIEYPHCYRTVDIEYNECLLLEDLCNDDFATIKAQTNEVTADHVRLVVKGLAKYHAISFAMKDQQPDTFNKLTENLSEVFINRANNTLRFYLNDQSASVFEAVADEPVLLAKVKEFYEREAVDWAADCIDIGITGPGSVISFGDSWQNNVMFKYNSDGTPTEARFVDFQAVRHCSPVVDIAFFIFCCTTKELRDMHYDAFLQIYHDTLSEHIRKLGSNPQKLFPFAMMQDHLQKCAKYGFILATVILPVLTTEKEFTLNFDEFGECAENGTLEPGNMLITERSQKKLHKRLRGIVADMMRLGYI